MSTNAILFFDGLETFSNNIACNLTHPTTATNLAGYMSWGQHSSLGADYAIDGTLHWKGNSGWWIIATCESFNGHRFDPGQGNFVEWFASIAFGGTNYSYIPVGAFSHVEEPPIGGINSAPIYFGQWAQGKTFGVSTWSSRKTPYFQAVGDPLVTR